MIKSEHQGDNGHHSIMLSCRPIHRVYHGILHVQDNHTAYERNAYLHANIPVKTHIRTRS